MTRAPRLSARMRALTEAAEIAEGLARHCRELCKSDGDQPIDRQAAAVAELIACLIRERMQDRRER